MKDYHSAQGVTYEPVSDARGFTLIPVLDFLKGRKWDEIALAYVGALNPKCIRVTRGECTCDAMSERVTVFVDKQDIIQSIDMSVTVHLPDGVDHGHHLSTIIRHGPDYDWKKTMKDSGI